MSLKMSGDSTGVLVGIIIRGILVDVGLDVGLGVFVAVGTAVLVVTGIGVSVGGGTAVSVAIEGDVSLGGAVAVFVGESSLSASSVDVEFSVGGALMTIIVRLSVTAHESLPAIKTVTWSLPGTAGAVYVISWPGSPGGTLPRSACQV